MRKELKTSVGNIRMFITNNYGAIGSGALRVNGLCKQQKKQGKKKELVVEVVWFHVKAILLISDFLEIVTNKPPL